MTDADLTEFLPAAVDEAPHSEWAKAEVVVGRDGGTLSTGTLSAPLELAGDWTGILKGFGLDPTVFEVATDTVRMGKWQSSKRLENGDRDTIWLYSYRASFRRRAPRAEDLDLEGLRRQVARWKPRKPPAPATGDPSTFAVFWADWQAGKGRKGGVDSFVAQVEESFELTVARLRELRRMGRNIERVAIFNMGDPLEGCSGAYEAQLFTVELTQREQLNLVLDLWLAGLRALEPDLFASCLCNHGDTWQRKSTGGRPITSDSDNAGGYLSDVLRRVCQESGKGPSQWLIPHDEMIGMANLSGINVAITHGHKIPSPAKETDWLRGQSIRLLRDYGHEPRLWVTAHRHHFRANDFGPWWRFQCPSLDPESKWFEDMSGEWATPGTLTMLIGQHDVRGWSDIAVLGSEP